MAPATPLRAVSPSGEVSFPLTFHWEGAGPRDAVRVAVVDRAERRVFAMEVAGSSAPAPNGLETLLAPGEPFSWTAAVVGPEGEATRLSLPVTFVVRR